MRDNIFQGTPPPPEPRGVLPFLKSLPWKGIVLAVIAALVVSAFYFDSLVVMALLALIAILFLIFFPVIGAAFAFLVWEKEAWERSREEFQARKAELLSDASFPREIWFYMPKGFTVVGGYTGIVVNWKGYALIAALVGGFILSLYMPNPRYRDTCGFVTLGIYIGLWWRHSYYSTKNSADPD